MKKLNVTEKIKSFLEPRKAQVKARLFVTREDGITIYDTIQDQTTASVSALVSGVWQASEALMGLVTPHQDVMEFRLGFDTSSQGISLFPFSLSGKRYFLGALYQDCLNPGQLKRRLAQIKEEMERWLQEAEAIRPVQKTTDRAGFLFQDISDEEIDRLFFVSGI